MTASGLFLDKLWMSCNNILSKGYIGRSPLLERRTLNELSDSYPRLQHRDPKCFRHGGGSELKFKAHIHRSVVF